jgi:molybdopterin synthase catalytic subunit
MTQPPAVTHVSKAEYVDALNEYYGYKHRYDEKFEEDKNAVKHSDILTLSQKRAKIARIKRNRKCVSCGQSGGTHFTNEDGVLRAQCGNRSQPCSLRIEIVKGKFMNLEELANQSLMTADILKDQIIKTKLDLLFNYSTEDEALRQFEELRASLDQALDLYGGFRQKYLDVVRNAERREAVDALTADFYAAVQEFKDIVQRGADSKQDSSFIKDAVAHYVGKIQPLNDAIMAKKYVYCAVERSGNDACRLVQKPYTLEQLEFEIDVPSITVEARNRQLRERLARKRKEHLAAYIWNWTKDQERITGNVYEVANLDDPDTGKEELIDFIIENGVPTTKYTSKLRAKEREKLSGKI